MLILKILSITIPYLVLSYFAWIKKFMDLDYRASWVVATMTLPFYLLWLFGAFK